MLCLEMHRILAPAVGLGLAGLAATAGHAANEPADGDHADLLGELEDLRQRIDDQQSELDRQQDIIEAQQSELDRIAGRDSADRHRRAAEMRRVLTELLADADTRASLLDDASTAGWDGGFFLRSADRRHRLDIGGRIHPRYEYRRASDEENTSSFLMRRVRLWVSGHMFDERITFGIQPELARTANLRDAWINYAADEHLQARVGQFTVPFQWHRSISDRGQHFAERGVPSESFGFPSGRDIGFMLHGSEPDGRWRYGVGVFDGAGRNVARSDGDGHMVSGRAAWAALGAVPSAESDVSRSPEPTLAFGLGGQGAWRNEVRTWDLGRSTAGNPRADWITGTADIYFNWRNLSIAADGYLRHVDPQDRDVNSYTGWAWMVTAGYTVVPEHSEVVGRFSQLRLDRRDPETAEREWGVGLNVFHGTGHAHKTRLNLLRHDFDDRHESRVIVEHHLMF